VFAPCLQELERARAEVSEARAEVGGLRQQTREYVIGLKETARADKRALVKELSESIFTRMSALFDANDVMDGETVRMKMKECLKASAAAALKQLE
jgi:hypothetical protein